VIDSVRRPWAGLERELAAAGCPRSRMRSWSNAYRAVHDPLFEASTKEARPTSSRRRRRIPRARARARSAERPAPSRHRKKLTHLHEGLIWMARAESSPKIPNLATSSSSPKASQLESRPRSSTPQPCKANASNSSSPGSSSAPSARSCPPDSTTNPGAWSARSNAPSKTPRWPS